MGILLLLYLISNSFPAESHRHKIYQLVKTRRDFSPCIFRTLKGHSADSLLENLFPLAVEAEDLAMVKNLIMAGANVDANNCKLDHCPIPLTPLQSACLKGNVSLTQELITAGSEIDAPESGWKCSAILLAIYGYEESRWRGVEGPKPVDNDSLVDSVQKLLDGGASVNDGETGMNDTTKSIRQWRNKLEPGYCFYEIIAEQHSPLTLASKYKYKELVDFLILEGADIQFRMDGTSSALRQCLHDIPIWFEGEPCALASRLYEWDEGSAVRSAIVKMAHSLMQAGADLNDHIPCDSINSCEHVFLECYSVLDLAVLIGSPELVDVMLHAGAKTTNHSLDLAIEVKSFNIFSKLLAKGAAIPEWATTEKENATSLCVLDADSRGANHFDLQSKRALVLVAVRLGATSELDSLINSMNGPRDLLDGCTGLTRVIEDCCRSGHYESLRHMLEAGIIPKLHAAVFGRSVSLIISHNQEQMLDLILENGADVNARHPALLCPSKPPILLAIEKGNLELVRKLLTAGANVDNTKTCQQTGCFGTKPENILVEAIATNNLPMIEEILQGCVDVNGFGEMDNYYGATPNCLCCTPITVAIKKRNWELVDRLYRGGANVNDAGRDPGVVRYFTPLWAAMNEKHYLLVKFLVNAGAIVNDRLALEAAVDNDDLLELFITKLSASTSLNKKCNALHFALLKSLHQNSIPKVKLILDSQLVDLSAVQGGVALRAVLASGHGVNHTLLNLLLTARANPNYFVFGRRTALLNAIATKDAKSVEILLKAGATTNPPFPSQVHYSPVQLAAEESSLEVLQMLLAHGCDPNVVAPGGQSQDRESIGSAIQCATEKGNFEIIQLLLMHDANPNAVTKTCPHTALQIASRDGSKSIAELLIMYGADVNAPPTEKFGATALQFAALGGYLGVAHLLMDKGANVNAPPAKVDGRTALEAAAEYGRIDMVQLLKNAGADLSETGDGQYERALARAFNNGHYATRRLLLSYLT
jgi:ankyrin repeat protein